MQHQTTFDATSEAHRLLTHKVAYELNAVAPPSCNTEIAVRQRV